MKLHIFNPETDFALGHNMPTFTPTQAVIALRSRLALLPALYADSGDAILTVDKIDNKELTASKYYKFISDKRIVSVSDLRSIRDSITHINPWGWNSSLIYLLHSAGISDSLMPDNNQIKEIRRLANRRVVIDFKHAIRKMQQLPKYATLPLNYADPIEFFDVDALYLWISSNPGCFIKSPWSSSGRGVFNTIGITDLRKVIERCRGIIKRQGSVIVEIGVNKALDFATEWYVANGVATFSGFSIFKTNKLGGYEGNILGSNGELRDILINHVSAWDDALLDLQKECIENVFAPYYNGPLGIDMMVTNEGMIEPCVEVNLRHTMGQVACCYYNLTGITGIFVP
jgi:hypothetical protein